MGRYTDFTRLWLDARYARTDAAQIYHAHQPIYGRGVPTHSEPDHLFRLARQYQILTVLNELSFTSFLDVGGSEGFGAHLVRSLFGARVCTTDLSVEAGKRAADLFRISAVAADGIHLPFADKSFDVVLCTEVLEHVEHPVEMILEMRRVARRALILTSDQVTTDLARATAHRVPLLPHIERNLFHADDFAAILGGSVSLRSQQKGKAPADTVPDEEAAAWMREALSDPSLVPTVGVLALALLDPAARVAPRLKDERLMREILAPAHPIQPLVRRPLALDRWAEGLVHPLHKTPLVVLHDALLDPATGERFVAEGGVPRLFARKDPSREETAAQFRRQFAGDESLVARALAVRDRLETKTPEPRSVWEFSEASAREEWMAGPGAEIDASDGEALRILSRATTPFIVGPPIRYPRSGLAGFQLDLEVLRREGATGAGARFWWIGPRDPGFDPSRSLPLELPPVGERKTISVALQGAPNDEVDEHDYVFRIDPLDGEGVVRLFRFRIEAGTSS